MLAYQSSDHKGTSNCSTPGLGSKRLQDAINIWYILILIGVYLHYKLVTLFLLKMKNEDLIKSVRFL